MVELGELRIPKDDGTVVDARRLPVQRQVQAFEIGLIPYVPASGAGK